MIENRIRKCSDFGTNVDTLRQFLNALMMQLVGPLATKSVHLYIHDRFLSVRGTFWTHKTSTTPSLFIEVSVPS